MSFVVSYLHMKNLSSDIAFSVKQLIGDALLPLAAHNAKT